MTVGRSKTYAVSQLRSLYLLLLGCCKSLIELLFLQFYDIVTVVRFGLRKPNINGKLVASVDSLLFLLIFNIAFDTTIVPSEGYRIQLAGYYTFLTFTGVRPIEIVDNEPSKPKDGTWDELYSREAFRNSNKGNDSDIQDEYSRLLEDLLY